MKTKKIIPAVTALCAVAAICCGCNDKPKAPNEYDELNAKLDMAYSQVVLTVTETFGEGVVLTGEYTMKSGNGGMTVAYTVERFSELSLDSAAPEKTTLSGEATVAGGTVTYVRGDEVDLDALTKGFGLSFKEEYFENADLTDVYIKADVKNASGFMGTAVAGTDMKVFATFGVTMRNIRITYTAENGSLVEYDYAFKK